MPTADGSRARSRPPAACPLALRPLFLHVSALTSCTPLRLLFHAVTVTSTVASWMRRAQTRARHSLSRRQTSVPGESVGREGGERERGRPDRGFVSPRKGGELCRAGELAVVLWWDARWDVVSPGTIPEKTFCDRGLSGCRAACVHCTLTCICTCTRTCCTRAYAGVHCTTWWWWAGSCIVDAQRTIGIRGKTNFIYKCQRGVTRKM